jgi:hypothetical protein
MERSDSTVSHYEPEKRPRCSKYKTAHGPGLVAFLHRSICRRSLSKRHPEVWSLIAESKKQLPRLGLCVKLVDVKKKKASIRQSWTTRTERSPSARPKVRTDLDQALSRRRSIPMAPAALLSMVFPRLSEPSMKLDHSKAHRRSSASDDDGLPMSRPESFGLSCFLGR